MIVIRRFVWVCGDGFTNTRKTRGPDKVPPITARQDCGSAGIANSYAAHLSPRNWAHAKQVEQTPERDFRGNYRTLSAQLRSPLPSLDMEPPLRKEAHCHHHTDRMLESFE
jgi:hypothetical protein